MPKPVEAFPCGSRSINKTCSPAAASAVPRLIAVVVLPTPPFWLAMAITRGGVCLVSPFASESRGRSGGGTGKLGDLQDDGMHECFAGRDLDFHVPVPTGRCQFFFNRAAFQK